MDTKKIELYYRNGIPPGILEIITPLKDDEGNPNQLHYSKAIASKIEALRAGISTNLDPDTSKALRRYYKALFYLEKDLTRFFDRIQRKDTVTSTVLAIDEGKIKDRLLTLKDHAHLIKSLIKQGNIKQAYEFQDECITGLESLLGYFKRQYKCDLLKTPLEPEINEVMMRLKDVIDPNRIQAIHAHRGAVPPQQQETSSAQNEGHKTKSITDNIWFKVGLLFATGEIDKYLKPNKKALKEGYSFRSIAKELGNESTRPYISASINNTPDTDKNIFLYSKKINAILNHCQENSISISKSFQEKCDLLPTD